MWESLGLSSKRPPARLALEDGTVLYGTSFGAEGTAPGEVIFNTALTGYQEVLTDPSYRGQIVTMTYPLIGNYGTNTLDVEADRVHVAGFVVRELSSICSSWRAAKELSDYLASEGVTGIEDVDTRFLTRKLRTVGVMNGVISTEKVSDEDLVQMAREAPKMEGQDLVRDVTAPDGYPWNRGRVRDYVNDPTLANQDGPLVVAIDFGIKRSILRNLCDRGFRVEVVPAKLPAEEILAKKPDGVFLSNGPGDPEPVRYGIRTVRSLLGQVPVFGICLGHQILGLALGGRTYKLRFGHHGANHPVRNLATNKVEITSQNHGFCVDIDSLAGKGVDVTHMNLNDDTLEGIRCKEKKCFSVQYHPEASPGPHDSAYLFDEFRKVVEEGF